MKLIYYIKGNKYWKFKNPKTPYIFDKTLGFFIVCDKFYSKDKKILKEE